MIIFAIPSYDRVNLLKEKTLRLLDSYNVPRRNIFIFVANKEEETKYSSLKSKYKIVVGVKGIGTQRNFIINYFTEGSKVVMLDDDIDMLHELKGNRQVKLPNLMDFVKSAFKECEEHNLGMWGVYPSDNAFFQKRNITYDRRFIIGQIFGVIVSHDKKLNVSIVKNEKEDYERTLRFYKKYGGVVRYNYISVKTKNYAEGGISSVIDRVKASKLNSHRLKKAFADAVEVIDPKPNHKYYELRLYRN